MGHVFDPQTLSTYHIYYTTHVLLPPDKKKGGKTNGSEIIRGGRIKFATFWG